MFKDCCRSCRCPLNITLPTLQLYLTVVSPQTPRCTPSLRMPPVNLSLDNSHLSTPPGLSAVKKAKILIILLEQMFWKFHPWPVCILTVVILCYINLVISFFITLFSVIVVVRTILGYRWINPVAAFLRLFTVAFLLFLVFFGVRGPAHAGQIFYHCRAIINPLLT